MANKYVDTSATNNGDGTASNQAATAGAVGAWNNLVNALKGTPGYGSLAAGDVVYIRTHDGANPITVTVGASFSFNTTATEANPIIWIFDDGSIWPQSAEMTISIGSTYAVTMSAYNNIRGNNKVKWYDSVSGAHHQNWIYFDNQRIEKCKFQTVQETAGFISSLWSSQGCTSKFYDCIFNMFRSYSTGLSLTELYCFLIPGNYSLMKFFNCIFDQQGTISTPHPFFGRNSYTLGFHLFGGKMQNVADTRYLSLCLHPSLSTTPSICEIIADGFDPSVLILRDQREVGTAPVFTANGTSRLRLTNIPGGKYDFTEYDSCCFKHWRYNQNYPTLNAQLPDNTYWSLKVHPTYVSSTRHGKAFDMTKMYNAAAATKTITVEMLLNASYTSLAGDDWYMEVTYVDDTTGATQVINTYGGTALVTSTAGWSTTSYGAENYNKYKISAVTPTSIRQYSDITVKVFSKKAAPTTTSFYFIDPDFIIT